MAYLEHIVRNLEDAFKIQVHGQFHGRTEIEGVCFYNGRLELPPEIADKLLYLGSFQAEESSLCRPQNLLLTGQKEPLSDPHILWIQESLSAADVFNAVQEVIFKHNTQKQKREDLFQALYSGHGITGIAHAAHAYLNNPVTVCDTSFSVIAASPVVKDANHLTEKHGRLYLKEPLFQNMADQKILKHLYSSCVPYLTTLDDFPYLWVFQSIRIRHTVAGYICVRGTVREFTEDDLDFINVFSQMLSIELQKDAGYRHPTGLKYEYFLTELLEGRFDRTEYITRRLLQLGCAQTPFYTILILKFTDPAHNPQQYKGYYEQLSSILPNGMPVLFHDELTVLLPSDTIKPLQEKCQNRFLAFLQFNQMRAFLSYPYSDIAKSSAYCHQAIELSLLYEKSPHPENAYLVSYETYFLEHIFYQCKDTQLLRASIHPCILQILEYDRTANTEYAQTLRIYLSQNRNALASAKQLHIHKSTFFYRLGKMADLFGIDINDSLALFTYEYSFRAFDYLYH